MWLWLNSQHANLDFGMRPQNRQWVLLVIQNNEINSLKPWKTAKYFLPSVSFIGGLE